MDTPETLTRLAEYIGDSPRKSGGRLVFDWHETDRDGASLIITPDGKVQVLSWLESRHNGDSYDNRTVTLGTEATADALKYLGRQLRSSARALALGQIKKREEARVLRDADALVERVANGTNR